MHLSTSLTCSQAYAAEHWVKGGAPRHKLIIGVPVYGRTFTLSDTTKTGIGAPAKGGGKAGKYTREAGYLSYYEVCKNLLELEYETLYQLLKLNTMHVYEMSSSQRTACSHQVCEFLEKGAEKHWMEEQMVPYAVSGDQWVGYDNERSLRIKVREEEEEEEEGKEADLWRT